MRHLFSRPRSPQSSTATEAVTAAEVLRGTALVAGVMALAVWCPAMVMGQATTAEPPAAVSPIPAAEKDAEKDAKSIGKSVKKKSALIAQITLAGSVADGVGQGDCWPMCRLTCTASSSGSTRRPVTRG